MINELFNAFNAEIQALLAVQTDIMLQSATILDDTQFDEDNMPAYTLPLIVLSINTSNDDGQFIGGYAKNEYQILIKIYNYQPNADLGEMQGYSISLLEIVDIFRRHFEGYIYLTDVYNNYISNYNFKMNLSSIDKAEKLKRDNGIVPGYILDFSSISIDNSVTPIIYAPLDIIEEVVGDIEMIITPKIVNETNTGGMQMITIQSNVSWNLSKTASWIILSKNSGTLDYTFIITIAANATGISRTSNIIVNYWGDASQVIVVNQSA